MTSAFDVLACLEDYFFKFLMDDRKDEIEIIRYVMNKAREEIEEETELEFRNWIGRDYYKQCNKNEDYILFRWFTFIHYNVSHTDKWHLRVLSRIYPLIQMTYELFNRGQVPIIEFRTLSKIYPEWGKLVERITEKKRILYMRLKEKKGM